MAPCPVVMALKSKEDLVAPPITELMAKLIPGITKLGNSGRTMEPSCSAPFGYVEPTAAVPDDPEDVGGGVV